MICQEYLIEVMWGAIIIMENINQQVWDYTWSIL